ncbi:unnamed protein product [Pleuronectes platessa]|uniref:Uncharacterized protein n=1 Tax=Pleuronectes platessa TaxID=8262 RepID=A0A9N7ZCH5_PLEPL|nr:unnamed protein product [Pleuronectes platessa]
MSQVAKFELHAADLEQIGGEQKAKVRPRCIDACVIDSLDGVYVERTHTDLRTTYVSELLDDLACLSDSTSDDHSLSSYTSESFDDNASIVTVIRLVNDAVDDIESEVSNMDKEQQRNSPVVLTSSSCKSSQPGLSEGLGGFQGHFEPGLTSAQNSMRDGSFKRSPPFSQDSNNPHQLHGILEER